MVGASSFVGSQTRVLFALTFALLLAISNSQAGLINVLVLDDQAGTDAGFGVGGRYEDAYNDLIDSANFGSGGTVANPLNILAPVSSLTGVDLSNVGIIILAHTHLQSLTFGDGVAVANHVFDNGASVLGIGHSWSDIESNSHANLGFWMTNSGRFPNSSQVNPYKIPNSDNTTVQFVGTGPASGVFGDLQGQTVRSDLNQYTTGTTGSPTGTAALTYSDSSGTESDGYYGDYGDGKFMLIGSINAFGDGDIGGSTLASRYNEGVNEEFFLNSIAFLADGTITVPEPSSLLLASCVGIAVIIRRKNKGRNASVSA